MTCATGTGLRDAEWICGAGFQPAAGLQPAFRSVCNRRVWENSFAACRCVGQDGILRPGPGGTPHSASPGHLPMPHKTVDGLPACVPPQTANLPTRPRRPLRSPMLGFHLCCRRIASTPTSTSRRGSGFAGALWGRFPTCGGLAARLYGIGGRSREAGWKPAVG